MRKSRDYVYGKCQYRVARIKELFESVCWGENDSSVMYKTRIKARNKEKNPSPLYQIFTLTDNQKPKLKSGGKWFTHGSKPRKENQLLSLEAPLLIILGIVCVAWSFIKRRSEVTFPIRFFVELIHGEKHSRVLDMCRNSVPHITHCILSKYSQYPVQGKQCPERADHLRPPLDFNCIADI